MGSPLGDKARVFGAGRGGDMVAGTRGSWSQCISSQEAEAAGRMLVPKSNFPFSTQARAYLSTHTWRSENKFVEVALLPGIKLQPSGLVASPSTH